MARDKQKGQAVAVSDDFVASWALMSADLPAARPALQASQEVDVVVVGGGFAGLHTALALAEYGQSVMLLEEGRIAGKASGANAGMVEAGFFVDFDALMAQIGAQEARQIYRLSMAGVERLRGLIRQSGRSDLLQGVGALTVSRQPQGPDFTDAVRRKADKTGLCWHQLRWMRCGPLCVQNAILKGCAILWHFRCSRCDWPMPWQHWRSRRGPCSMNAARCAPLTLLGMAFE